MKSWIAIWRTTLLTVVLSLAFTAISPRMTVAKTTEDERKMGKEVSEQIAADKSVRFVTDAAIVERVDRIGAAVSVVANEPDLTYSFKVIDTPEPNAFSLPGGYIYLNKGLIDRCESDDELAGVIAHEIAHAANHHMRQLIAKQAKFDPLTWALLIAGAAGADISQAALLSQVVTLARVNNYGIRLETEADNHAVAYLRSTSYNPVGILTFMERMARDDAFNGRSRVPLGIFQTHPLSRERVQNLINLLTKEGISIERRKVLPSFQVTVKEARKENVTYQEIWIGKRLVVALGDDGAMPSAERAETVATRIDAVLDRGMGLNDIRIGNDPATVFGGKNLLITVTDRDAGLVGLDKEAVAKRAMDAIRSVIWQQLINTIY